MSAGVDGGVLVYDVGGSHVAAAVCSSDFKLGAVATAHYLEVETTEAFLVMLADLATRAGAKGARGASLAMPGPFDYESGVSWMKHKLAFLYGVNVGELLAERLGLTAGSVHFINDAAAFLLGEVGAGAARGAHKVVGFTLGTGIGSGFAIDGQIQKSGVGVPPGGEIWNVPFEGGIVEDVVSTRAIQKIYRERTGKEAEVVEIAKAAQSDAVAAEVFAQFGRDLGRVLRIQLKEFAPDRVVLGGGIARSAPLFLAETQRALQGVPFSVAIAELGDSAALVGAGVAWFRSR